MPRSQSPAWERGTGDSDFRATLWGDTYNVTGRSPPQQAEAFQVALSKRELGNELIFFSNRDETDLLRDES